MIVRLPGDRSLVVDAKVPLTAYLEAAGASDEPSRRAFLQRHGQQLAEHVRQLAGKQYWSQFQPAPELVVLFLPGDHFFSAALEANPDLIEDALARKVVIATPITLISILRGIAYGWGQEQLAENAEAIRAVASELYDRVQLVYDHYADTGRMLEKTVASYNRSVGSWDSRLVPVLRKMRELGVCRRATSPTRRSKLIYCAAPASGRGVLESERRALQRHVDDCNENRSGGRQEIGAICAQVW